MYARQGFGVKEKLPGKKPQDPDTLENMPETDHAKRSKISRLNGLDCWTSEYLAYANLGCGDRNAIMSYS